VTQPPQQPVETTGPQIGSALTSVADLLSKAGAAAAAIILIGVTAFTLIEIALRVLRGSGTNVVVEFVGYSLAAMTFLAASSTMREGGFVRIALVVERLPPAARRACDFICVLATLVSVGMAAAFIGSDMWRSFQRGYETDSLVALPMWLPPLPLMIGLVIFLLDMLLLLVGVARGTAQVADEAPEVI
jgi:TRAP-type C4-dicarboxylate transport system permease small subunit